MEKSEVKACEETLRLKLILEGAWKLAFDIAVRTMSIEEAQQEGWMKVAGSVKLMIDTRRPDKDSVREVVEKALSIAEQFKEYAGTNMTKTFYKDVDTIKTVANRLT